MFIGYGTIYNWDLFWLVQTSQAGRDLGLATLQNRFFMHPTIVARTFFDGWVVLGLFAVFSLFATNLKKNATDLKNFSFLKIFFVVNLMFILATVGERTFHGWYDYVLYPLFCLGLGWLFVEIWEKEKYLLLGLVWILLLPGIRQILVHAGVYEGLSNFQLRLIMILGGLPFGLNLLKKNFPKTIFNRKLIKLTILGLLLVVFLANISTVFTFNHRDYWESDEFFLPSRVVK